MVKRLRKSRWMKIVSCYLFVSLMVEIIAPSVAFALTSGPSAPEVQSFSPADNTDMVNLFTGDFSYNLPLFELPGPNGGYPFNLSYAAGISMDQEASWVGLGWNLNPGSINRDVRGIPDDFRGDEIKVRKDMKENATTGVRVAFNYELAGADFGKLGMSFGLNIYYNTYRGIGLGTSTGASFHSNNTGQMNGGIGLNLSLDSQEGVGLSPSLSVEASDAESSGGFNFGMGYNSKKGLTDLGFGISHSKILFGNPISTSFSFANSSYTPNIDMEMSGYNITISLKFGGKIVLNKLSGEMAGYHNTQYPTYSNVDQTRRGYGLLHLDEGFRKDINEEERIISDINREKDGVVRKETPNLGIPSLTHDVYNISGQGIGGAFRAYRGNVALLSDPYSSSLLGGGAIGVEASAGNLAHPGIDVSVNVSKSKSKYWNGGANPDLQISYAKLKAINNPDYQPYYFKFSGDPAAINEKTFNNINDDNANNRSGTTNLDYSNDTYKRVPRANSIQEYFNRELAATQTIAGTTKRNLSEFAIMYSSNLDGSPYSYSTSLDRISNISKAHHIGGFTSLQPDGKRYIYGLPVYNTNKEERVYSVKSQSSNTNPDLNQILPANEVAENDFHKLVKSSDQYLNATTIPAFTSSHLLTSVLGDDYIDADNVDGPSDNDFGYWVKFNYAKAEQFKWKVPYEGANYSKGLIFPGNDDKASYEYGAREQYYLTSAETKTHIAKFHLSKRADSKGVIGKYSASIGSKASSYKIDYIELFSKEEIRRMGNAAVPISKVHFEYSYELCPNIPNFVAADKGNLQSSIKLIGGNTMSMGNERPGNGKLTLKKVWFTYERSNRGALNPYEFNYSNTNPSYNRFMQDRWGMYKNDNPEETYDFPYCEQYNQQKISDNVKSWNLISVNTPSGSEIKVEYEPDDYAYVQNKIAGQMFRISHLYDVNHPDRVHDYGYDNVATGKQSSMKNGNELNVYFKLEEPLAPNEVYKLQDYIKDLKTPDGVYQLYFKVKAYMRTESESQFQEYVSGYAEFQKNHIYPATMVGGKYTEAYIQLDLPKIADKYKPYHPFALAAWQYMRTNLSQYATTPGKLNTPAGEAMSSKDKALEIASMITQIRDVFTKYTYRAAVDGWAKKIDLNHSFIRLNTPDKRKYGGGHRVKKITITNPWDQTVENNSTPTSYGLVYDYSLSDQTSSGVAQYEPMVGGDEISLRYAKIYPEHIPLKTPNNLFFEYPINESYFPAPIVGYSKVSVRSIAADAVASLSSSPISGLPNTINVPTTGETQHEFYTAKDYPIRTGETSMKPNAMPFNLSIPIPFIGSIAFDDLQASQGYVVELNDMHGKPKMVSYYGHDNNGKIDYSKAVSSVSYLYQNKPDNIIVNGVDAPAFQLKSDVSVMKSEGQISAGKYEMGVDYESFIDNRWCTTRSGNGGVALNFDPFMIGPIVIPPFVPWPEIGISASTVRLSVTNKIIRRTGILAQTIANDGQSSIKTNNLVYDEISGTPVLTSVDNNYDDPIYQYHIPAYWEYKGMGPAYENFGMINMMTYVNNTDYPNLSSFSVSASVASKLNEGDELVFTNSQSTLLSFQNDYFNHLADNNVNLTKGIVDKIDGTNIRINCNGATAFSGDYIFRISRSGKRNLLNAEAGNIVALQNPLINRNSLNSVPFRSNSKVEPLLVPEVLVQLWRDIVFPPNNSDFQDMSTGVIKSPYESSHNGALSYGYLPFRFTNTQQGGTLKFPISTLHAKYTSLNTTEFDNFLIAYFQIGNIAPNDKLVITFSPLIIANTPPSASSFVSLNYEGQNSHSCTDNIEELHDGGLIPMERRLGQISSISINPSHTTIHFETASLNPSYSFNTNWYTLNCGYNFPSFSCSENVSSPAIDKVLSATATKYSSIWIKNGKDLKGTGVLNNNSTMSDYQKGNIGIWRPIENYTYVDDRVKQTNTTDVFDQHLIGPSSFTKVNLRKDGVFHQVPIFNWAQENFRLAYPKWRLSNNITKYNPYGAAVENKDILGNYSSSVVSFNGKLPVVSAVNSKNDEVGAESFEEYAPNSPVDYDHTGTTNFIFPNTSSSGINYSEYDRVKILVAQNGDAVLNIPFQEFSSKYQSSFDNVLVEVFRPNGSPLLLTEGQLGNWTVSNYEGFNGTLVNNLAALRMNNRMFSNLGCWEGNVYFNKQKQLSFPESDIEYSNKCSHSGKNSLRVNKTVTIPQPDLHLKAGKRYVLSCWVNLLNNNYSTEVLKQMVQSDPQFGIHIGFAPPNTTPSSINWINVNTIKTGLIDGWSKLESEAIDIPQTISDKDILYIQLTPLMAKYEKIGIVPFSVYYDDLRIHPFDANVKSYVYDPKSYKLVAELDNNNFATFYSYDEQGNLYLIKRETEKGIMTVQESRNHLKEKQ